MDKPHPDNRALARPTKERDQFCPARGLVVLRGIDGARISREEAERSAYAYSRVEGDHTVTYVEPTVVVLMSGPDRGQRALDLDRSRIVTWKRNGDVGDRDSGV